MKVLIIILIISAQILNLCAGVSYNGYKLYNVVPKTDKEVQDLNELRNDDGIEFWSDVVRANENVLIMVAPEKDKEFDVYTKNMELDVDLRIPDIQKLIDDQQASSRNVTRNNPSPVGTFDWDDYHTLPEIHAWLDQLAVTFPDKVKTIVIGHTLGFREIKGIIIDLKPGERGDEPLIGMIEGGIHAREWISPATVTYIINAFLTSSDENIKLLAESVVWHIFPVINPDGYVYTYVTGGDRLWRKNRNPAHHTSCGSQSDDLSNGIDLNRNFNFLWNTVGVSSNPCAQTFPGASPTSELEAQAISNYVMNLKEQGNVVYYISFHSFSQMILIPYSHLAGLDVLQVENYPHLYLIGIRGAQKLYARHGTWYQVGTSKDILYEVSGSSFDWAKGVAEIPIVYLFELRDVGQHGFLLPKEQIMPNCEEIMDCLVEMNDVTRALGYHSGSATILSSILLLAISAGLVAVNQF